jgi:uncharacterized protein YdhG (YjbR/CyaY superfamily)
MGLAGATSTEGDVMAETKKPSKSSTATDEPAQGWTDEERAAMKERAQEVKAARRRGSKADKAADDAKAVLVKIAEMPQPDKGMAERVHAVVMETAPDLAPRLWYGSPAYAKDGKVIVFFQNPQKFKTKYATLGFSEDANLEDGEMWPSSFAVLEVTPAVEKQIAVLVKKAVS